MKTFTRGAFLLSSISHTWETQGEEEGGGGGVSAKQQIKRTGPCKVYYYTRFTPLLPLKVTFCFYLTEMAE